MPRGKRGERAEDLLRLATSDPLFHQLRLLYEWMLPPARYSRFRTNAQNALESFQGGWCDLLPPEREDVVGRLVSRFCLMEAGIDVGWEMLGYTWLCRAVKRASSSPTNVRPAAAELKEIEALVERVVQAVPHAHVATLSTWREGYFGDEGVTRGKLHRMTPMECAAFKDELAKVADRAQTLVDDGHSLAHALPSADSLFSTVFTTLQPPHESFRIFSRSVGDLFNLYHWVPRPGESQVAHLEYLDHARGTLLSDAEAASFLLLDAAKRHAAVALARDRLFDACKTRMADNVLPGLSTIVHELCVVTMHENVPQTSAFDTFNRPALHIFGAPHSPRVAGPRSPQNLPPSTRSEHAVGVNGRQPFFPDSRRQGWQRS